MSQGKLLTRTIPELWQHLEKTRDGWDSFIRDIPLQFEYSCSDGKTGQNMFKNRYSNVWPYNYNRVELPGGYINASHVSAPLVDNKYICTQEPLNGSCCTKGDFWSMVWEQETTLIVMLNNVFENNSYSKPDYLPYFPTGHKIKGKVMDEVVTPEGNLKIKLVSREDHECYILSKLELTHENSAPRTINHLLFMGWHDYDIPKSPLEMIKFLADARQLYNPERATVVHCSAGVGRTGSFVLIDTLISLCSKYQTDNIDVESVVRALRKQRMWMVQTSEQLRFCVESVVKMLQGMNTEGWGNDRVSLPEVAEG